MVTVEQLLHSALSLCHCLPRFLPISHCFCSFQPWPWLAFPQLLLLPWPPSLLAAAAAVTLFGGGFATARAFSGVIALGGGLTGRFACYLALTSWAVVTLTSASYSTMLSSWQAVILLLRLLMRSEVMAEDELASWLHERLIFLCAWLQKRGDSL